MPEQFGKYDILGELGAGGMAVVFKARDTLLKRTVALKVIHHKLQDGEFVRKRFLNEGRAAAALSHPNIVAIYELGIEDGQPFIAMEYLSGVDLREILDAHTPLGLRQKLDIALEVAKALEHAHSRGVIHRDIKPGNIRVAEDGHARLMDFGIAKVTSEEVTRLTRTGGVVGTLAYMSPEQLRGESPTEAADVFAFGVVLYELLTGKRPFEGPHSPAVMHQVLYTEPTPIADGSIPDALAKLVKDCLKKSARERIERFPRIVEVLSQVRREVPELEEPPHDLMQAPTSAALRDASGGSGDRSTWGSPIGPSVQRRSRRTVLTAVLVPGLLLTLGFVLFVPARLGDFGSDLRSGASNAAPPIPSPLQARTPDRPTPADVRDVENASASSRNEASNRATPGSETMFGQHAPTVDGLAPTVGPQPRPDAMPAAPAATPTLSGLRFSKPMVDSSPKTRQRVEALPTAPPPSPALLTPRVGTTPGRQQSDAAASGGRLPASFPPAVDRSTGPSVDGKPETASSTRGSQVHGVRELRVRAPEGTQICLDGQVAPASRSGVSWTLSGVSAGRHVLRLIHPAKGTAEGSIEVQPETDLQRVIFEDSEWKAPGFRVTVQSTDRGMVPFEGRAGEDYRFDLGGGQTINLRLQLAAAPSEPAELSLERGDGLQSTVRCVRGASGRGCQGPPWFECGAVH